MQRSHGFGCTEIRPQINSHIFPISFTDNTASLTDQIKPVHWREIKHDWITWLCLKWSRHSSIIKRNSVCTFSKIFNSFCLTILFKCSFCVTNAFLKLQTFRAVSRSVRTVNHMQNCCIKSVMFYQITLWALNRFHTMFLIDSHTGLKLHSLMLKRRHSFR